MNNSNFFFLFLLDVIYAWNIFKEYTLVRITIPLNDSLTTSQCSRHTKVRKKIIIYSRHIVRFNWIEHYIFRFFWHFQIENKPDGAALLVLASLFAHTIHNTKSHKPNEMLTFMKQIPPYKIQNNSRKENIRTQWINRQLIFNFIVCFVCITVKWIWMDGSEWMN